MSGMLTKTEIPIIAAITEKVTKSFPKMLIRLSNRKDLTMTYYIGYEENNSFYVSATTTNARNAFLIIGALRRVSEQNGEHKHFTYVNELPKNWKEED